MDSSSSFLSKGFVNEFDIAKAPIEGRYLIEANAGTGKTFSLVSLYLKFLFNGYSASEIIAVTFSRAATRELSIRIKASLEELLSSSLQISDEKLEKHTHSEVTYFLTQLEKMDKAAKVPILANLRDAVIHFEDHSVQTIDSFMNGFLSDYSFELGQFREKELLEDSNLLIDEIYWNFVRTYFSDYLFLNDKEENRYFLHYLLNKEPLSSSGQHGKNLKDKYFGFLTQPGLILRPELLSEEKYFFKPLYLNEVWGKDLNRLTSFKQLIMDYHSEMEEKLANKDFLKQVGSRRNSSSIKKWLEQIKSLDLEKYPINFDPILNFGELIRDVPLEKIEEIVEEVLTSSDNQNRDDLWVNNFFTEIKNFFGIIADFNETLEHNHLVFLHFFVDKMREEIKKKKEELGVFFYSDHTQWIGETLKKKKLANKNLVRMKSGLGGKHRAFLIDEFQDTDPEQYAVFDQIISLKQIQLNQTRSKPVMPVVAYFIGDPKQSIYRFRQANLETYFMAKESLTVFSLTKNYRTHAHLLKQVNGFFSNQNSLDFLDDRGEANISPFCNDNLAFASSSPDEAVTEKLEKKYPIALFPALFYLHRPPHSLGKPEKYKKEELETYFINQLVTHLREVQKELPSLYSTVLNNTAILAGTNGEVSEIKRLLDAKNVPSVVKSNERVYQTKEFLFLKVLLKAVLNPTPKNICAPFVWLGLTPSGSASRKFHTYLEIWQKKSFTPFLREVFDCDDYAFEVALLKQGKRSHTNFFHLVDMVIFLEKKTPTPLALFEKLENLKLKDIEQFDAELRYEGSGDAAIKIMTIHKSKGLEYDFVHILYPSKLNAINSQIYYLLNQKDKSIGILNFKNLIDLKLLSDKEQAIKEEVSESLRQFYVALTRAKLQINLYIGHDFLPQEFKVQEKTGKITYANPKTPLCWLLQDSSLYNKSLNLIERQYDASYNEEGNLPFIVEIKKKDTEPATIVLAKEGEATEYNINEPYVLPSPPKKNSYQTSFTALSSHPHIESHTEATLIKATPINSTLEMGSEVLLPTLTETADDIIHLRGGVATGNFFHVLIEQWNFSTNAKHLDEVLTRLVKRYPYFEKYQAVVLSSLERLKGVELFGQFAFKDFHGENSNKFNWLNELEFMLTLKKEESQLKEELRLYLNSNHQSFYSNMPINLTGKTKSSYPDNLGVVKGFIDLVVENENRYYIIDWKTNTLGSSLEDYHADALAQAIEENSYQLQVLIYLVGLERYLKSYLPDYDYDRHIGGVNYIFLRGLAHPKTRGVIDLTPKKKEFEEFKKLFC